MGMIRLSNFKDKVRYHNRPVDFLFLRNRKGRFSDESNAQAPDDHKEVWRNLPSVTLGAPRIPIS